MFSHYQIMQNIFTLVSLILLFFVSLLILISKKKNATNNNKIYPPSPPKLPFFGHLHLIGTLPHRSLCKLSKKYGPLMLLKIGSVPTIVVSSAYVAKEMFKVHDLASCSRPPSTVTQKFSFNYQDIAFSPYGDSWRELRKICVLELFNSRRVQSFRPIREEEISSLLKSIYESSCSAPLVDLSEKLYSLTANIITRVAFGKSFRGSELDNQDFLNVMHRGAAVAAGFSAVDFFPGIGWIIDRLSGAHGRLEKSFGELNSFIEQVVDDRMIFGQTSSNDIRENVLDVLLKLKKDGSEFDAAKLSVDCIKAVIMDIFMAGVETGANTLVWAMTELVKNPKVMKKLQNEIRSCIIKDQEQVKETDLEKLRYLKMVVKEVLRLHAPVPLLLPRETVSHFKLNGYDIDPKTTLYVNVWAIGRDPELWENPEEFFPERFIENSIDYKGQNFELLPFGAGRRICPGMNMAIVMVELALANMLFCFDWKLPNGMKEEDVDIEEEAGLAVAKKSPLQLVPVCYFNSIK